MPTQKNQETDKNSKKTDKDFNTDKRRGVLDELPINTNKGQDKVTHQIQPEDETIRVMDVSEDKLIIKIGKKKDKDCNTEPHNRKGVVDDLPINTNIGTHKETLQIHAEDETIRAMDVSEDMPLMKICKKNNKTFNIVSKKQHIQIGKELMLNGLDSNSTTDVSERGILKKLDFNNTKENSEREKTVDELENSRYNTLIILATFKNSQENSNLK